MEPLTPEEIQREFEDFVRNRFGDRVQIVSQHFASQTDSNQNAHAQDAEASHEESVSSGEFTESSSAKPGKSVLEFDFTPRQIKEYLDRFVIEQNEAKKALAIAVCDHYNHVRMSNHSPSSECKDSYDYSKQNVLILGPTGVGKTYLVKQIAKLIGVPFVKADATRFSETGYVGANVDDLIHDLVAQADGNIDLAQYGIVYLDEADKLAASPHAQQKDVNGRGVQFGLLKLMEETEVDLRSGNDMRTQMQAFMEFQRRGKVEKKIVNTRHILFIISGSFNGLAEIIKQRLAHNAIGFRREGLLNAHSQDDEYLRLASTEDFINFGFEPEFIGRLPIRVSCNHLNAAHLHTILKESEGSIIRQYLRAFEAYGISISFTDGALKLIAEKAAQEKTGARALMTICEKTLREFKYELPSSPIDQFIVDEDLVANPEKTLSALLKERLN